MHFDIRYAAIGRNQTVQFLQISAHERLNLSEGHSFGQSLIREYKSYQFSIALYDQRLAHSLLIIQLVLNLLRIDILTGRTQEHGLAATLDIDILFLIESSEVTGTQPSVFRKCRCRRFGVLVITHHHIFAFHEYLADTGLVGLVGERLRAQAWGILQLL